MKKVVKSIGVTLLLVMSVLTGLVMILDPLEEWAYKKFGKEEVRAYMKRFEPYIVMSQDEVEDTEHSLKPEEDLVEDL